LVWFVVALHARIELVNIFFILSSCGHVPTIRSAAYETAWYETLNSNDRSENVSRIVLSDVCKSSMAITQQRPERLLVSMQVTI